MKPENVRGWPVVDDALADVPQLFSEFAGFEQKLGYKAWKIPGRRNNWIQWNDGDRTLPIRFDNIDGVIRTWKVFVRFPAAPAALWERPAPHDRDFKFMISGLDVWGCTYEALSGFEGRFPELKRTLLQAFRLAQSYVGA